MNECNVAIVAVLIIIIHEYFDNVGTGSGQLSILYGLKLSPT